MQKEEEGEGGMVFEVEMSEWRRHLLLLLWEAPAALIFGTRIRNADRCCLQA
jgi:hypothetical protein